MEKEISKEDFEKLNGLNLLDFTGTYLKIGSCGTQDGIFSCYGVSPLIGDNDDKYAQKGSLRFNFYPPKDISRLIKLGGIWKSWLKDYENYSCKKARELKIPNSLFFDYDEAANLQIKSKVEDLHSFLGMRLLLEVFHYKKDEKEKIEYLNKLGDFFGG